MSAARRQKARDLVELATNEKTPEKERLVAAVQVCNLISKYDLLSSPLDSVMEIDNETVQAATNIFNVLTDPSLMSSVKKVAGRFGKKRRK